MATKEKVQLSLNSNNQTKVSHCVPSIFDHLISFLNECRKTGQFCDWTLKSEDGLSLQVHRVVLISTCPYFRAMFSSGLAECRKESFIVKNVSGVCLKLLIDYLYNGEIELTIKNAKEMLNIANYMCLKHLSRFCLQYLIENANNENCLELWRYSNEIENDEMKNKFKYECLNLILKDLKSLQENTSFMINLKFEELLNLLLSHKNYPHKNNENICSFVMKWITSDFKNRNLHIKTIMEKLNFENLTQEFLTDEILQNEMMLESKDFLLKMTEVLKGKLELNGDKQQTNNDIPQQTVISDENDKNDKTNCSNGDNENEGDQDSGDEDDEDDGTKKKFKISYNNICDECEMCETWHVLKIE